VKLVDRELLKDRFLSGFGDDDRLDEKKISEIEKRLLFT